MVEILVTKIVAHCITIARTSCRIQKLFYVLDMIEDEGLSDKELIDISEDCFISSSYQGVDYFG
ncbi:MAG: hypothetical protein WDO19_03160 [Bacteroidota bacterium]